MTHLPRLASLVFNRPHYITRDAGLAIANVITRGELLLPEANRFVGEDAVDRDGQGRALRWRGYRMFGATAIVNVLGELVNRGAWLGSSSGLISYEGLATQLRSAATDPRVQRILLDVNSPGGEASGMTDMAALVRAIAAEKPVVAVANAMMCSAAYGLCSGATRIVTSDLGVVGSIGVVMMHADYSKALDKAGVAVTLIHKGEHKVDGNPFEALPDAVRADFEAECGKYYDAFVACVAAGRPSLTSDAIRSTEARTYLGKEAVDNGLADAVGTFESVLDELERGGIGRLVVPAKSPSSTAKTEEATVTVKANAKPDETPVTPATATEKTYTQAELDAAVATARASGQAAGRTEERARIKGIMSHEAAAGRQKMAAHIAFNTDFDVDAAAAMMATVDVTAAAPATASTDTMMGLELAAPVVPKQAAAPLSAQSVFAHRRKAN